MSIKEANRLKRLARDRQTPAYRLAELERQENPTIKEVGEAIMLLGNELELIDRRKKTIIDHLSREMDYIEANKDYIKSIISN